MAKIIHYLLDIGLYSKFLICCLEYGGKLPLKVLRSCDMIHKRELRFTNQRFLWDLCRLTNAAPHTDTKQCDHTGAERNKLWKSNQYLFRFGLNTFVK